MKIKSRNFVCFPRFFFLKSHTSTSHISFYKYSYPRLLLSKKLSTIGCGPVGQIHPTACLQTTHKLRIPFTFLSGCLKNKEDYEAEIIHRPRSLNIFFSAINNNKKNANP